MGIGRAREGLARAVDVVPLSARGALLALACAAALQFWGLRERDLVILVLALTGLGLVTLASFAVLLASLRLRAAALRAPAGPARLCVEVGRAAASGFALPRLRALGLLEVELHWIAPEGVRCEARARRGRLEEWITATRRFEVGRVQRRIAISDALGLARSAWELGHPQLASALPASGAAASQPPSGRAGGDDEALASGLPEGDRLDARPYHPGEPARHILWRSWARSGELFARAPERSAVAARRVAAYLVCGPGDEPAAGAARLALEAGALGAGWWFGAGGCAGVARRLDAALSLLARSGSARSSSGLAAFAERASAEPGTGLLLFAPAIAGAWVDEIERIARARGGDCSIVLALDKPALPRRRRAWRARRADRELVQLRARLARVARVAVVERAAGASGAAAVLSAPGSRA
jgi:uncharacterized protein (DUF58 family)